MDVVSLGLYLDSVGFDLELFSPEVSDGVRILVLLPQIRFVYRFPLGEINADLARPHPMLRLVQGDVGSGKTLVAAAAALQAIASGYQVAIMAPTEILAEQHRVNFESWFDGLGIETAWLSGRSKGKKRAEALARIASGEAGLVVGTHALFQGDVEFARLGLVVVDEQHRFGVHQRLALTEKAGSGRPHQLVMTATPIPRTLSMVAYADLDCSVIDELPPGRKPVETVLIDNGRRERVVERVAAACERGRQAYWVCTLVEESDVRVPARHHSHVPTCHHDIVITGLWSTPTRVGKTHLSSSLRPPSPNASECVPCDPIAFAV